MFRRRLWSGLGVLLALTACGETPPDVGVPLRAPSQAPSNPPSAGSSPSPSPTSGAPGTRVEVYSHCGVVSLTVRGRLWLADPPLGDHNPPPGWDENETRGRFVVVGPGRAEFHGDGGQRARFRLAPPGTADPLAGCE